MAEIARALLDEMVAHSRDALPNEACGMVHAVDGVATSVHRVTNAAASPYRYEMAPLEQLKLEQRRDRPRRRRVAKGQPGAGRFLPGFAQETLFAIYHSHVASEARPSPTDVNMAFWPPGETTGTQMYPETLYVVVSLAEDEPSVRAFHIVPGAAYEDCLEEVAFEVI